MTTSADVHYHIVPKHPEAHLFQINCTIQHPDPSGQMFSLPCWIPGSYMIRDFAKNIVTLSATCNNQPLTITKSDKASWQVEPCSGPLQISYDVYAWDLSVRTAHLDTTHGYFNGTSVFIQIAGKEHTKCTVDIARPVGDSYTQWRVATSMQRESAEAYGFGHYSAADYDELIDHPVEMGNFSLANFDVAGIPHDVVISGRHRADIPRLCQDLQRICENHVKMFGELPEMERYVFLVQAVGDGYGGLEHRSSTSLICSRNDLPRSNQTEVTEGYRTFLGLCSHEYFHTWNIKRIKPECFLPYDLSNETYTRQLWAFEGITSYYDDLGLLRSGRISIESYLELLGQTITRVWRGQGRFKQSVADSSFDAWTKFYKQDESAPNNIVSYYTKGALIALALDLIIRNATDDKASLDDVMRRLWKEYGKPVKGVPEGAIEHIAAEVAGKDLQPFFKASLYDIQDPPLQTLLADFGIEFHLRAASSYEDKGGLSADKNKAAPFLGARIADNNSGALLNFVFDNGPAQSAGLSAGDVIIAVDGLKVSKANLEKIVASYEFNSTIQIHAFRRDELMEFSVQLTEMEPDTCYLVCAKDASAEIIAKRNNWLQPYKDEA